MRLYHQLIAVMVLCLPLCLAAPLRAAELGPDRAEDGAMSAQRFAEAKKSVLQGIEDDLSNLQKRKECVTSAQTPKDLKRCRELAETARKDSLDRLKKARMQELEKFEQERKRLKREQQSPQHKPQTAP